MKNEEKSTCLEENNGFQIREMDRIIVFPYSLSSWRLQIMMEELGLACNVENVDMFKWEHLQLSHLRLSASVRSLLVSALTICSQYAGSCPSVGH